ncbi:transporter substrate-binding domain-containing protein [Brachyspira murdochii]|uniref:Amino acid ABC transporter substrate-binding protein n=1 Tax=Brachyspira murdochii TaxID=84378 RepID=A0ABX5B7F1_9SPIR|nr:transporter substrate-binding domain-containing protein [Brachyspira murdochii]PPS22542.1 amino acid ABC transporter substrate-binding protein [Brachyspira murdochii]
MKNILLISLCIILFVSCTNSTSKYENFTNNEEYIKNSAINVGIYVYDYPLLYLSNDNLGGFDYDIMNEIAKAENLKLEYIQTPFSELILSLQNDMIDIAIAGISITEERKKLVSFSDKYYSSSQSIIVLKDNNDIKVFDDLIGERVGVIKDTISDTIISASNNINVVRFDIAGSALLSLKIENVEAVMLDRVTCNNYIRYDNDIKIAEDIIFPELDYAIALKKNNSILLKKINSGLNTIMSNGVYENLINKHFN